MLKPVIDQSDLKHAVKLMKSLGTDTRKFFVKELKSDLQPFADRIRKYMNTQANPPLSGFGRTPESRFYWGNGVLATAYVTPSSRKSLARIEVFGRGAYKAALKMTDLAGTNGSYVQTTQGAAMIRELNAKYKTTNKKAGRFVWDQFIKQRPAMVHFIQETLDEFSKLTERRIYG